MQQKQNKENYPSVGADSRTIIRRSNSSRSNSSSADAVFGIRLAALKGVMEVEAAAGAAGGGGGRGGGGRGAESGAPAVDDRVGADSGRHERVTRMLVALTTAQPMRVQRSTAARVLASMFKHGGDGDGDHDHDHDHDDNDGGFCGGGGGGGAMMAAGESKLGSAAVEMLAELAGACPGAMRIYLTEVDAGRDVVMQVLSMDAHSTGDGQSAGAGAGHEPAAVRHPQYRYRPAHLQVLQRSLEQSPASLAHMLWTSPVIGDLRWW